MTNLTEAEQIIECSSLKQKWDYQNAIDYAVNTAVKTALEEERAKKHIRLKFIAKSLKDENLPLEAIAKATGLSIEEIEAL